ncbi:MAG: ATP-binding cassette domain-containing protein, partial [Thermoplasmata archaeon]|nr:ATP-binding cassette domain-containing protein [Thermoplasmata archaeon]
MSAGPLFEAVAVEKRFPITKSLADYAYGRKARAIHAVDGISLYIAPGETLGLIGESGSGKTTFGWLVARIHDSTGGRLLFEGKD